MVSQDSTELKLIAKAGDPIQEGGAAAEVLRTGSPVIKDVPQEVYGIPFRSYAVPLKEDNEVVGVLGNHRFAFKLFNRHHRHALNRFDGIHGNFAEANQRFG